LPDASVEALDAPVPRAIPPVLPSISSVPMTTGSVLPTRTAVRAPVASVGSSIPPARLTERPVRATIPPVRARVASATRHASNESPARPPVHALAHPMHFTAPSGRRSGDALDHLISLLPSGARPPPGRRVEGSVV
jgi:hypothetical protein